MLFIKKNKKVEDPTEDAQPKENKKKVKSKVDKSIKPRSPKSMVPRTIIRTIFWIFITFILIRGISSVVRGPQTIQKINITGNTTPAISDSIKGFATDFATEYFTWTSTDLNKRIERLSRFISGIDQDAGMKSYQISGDSKVLSVELYDSTQIDDTHFEITTIVRREVNAKKSEITATDSSTLNDNVSSKENSPSSVQQKSYMIVPVTLTKDGPLIQNYPRFVMERNKGNFSEDIQGELVSDGNIIQSATELTESFFKTYFEGNINQLKYFYINDNSAPKTLVKSDFILNKIVQIQVYKVIDNTTDSRLRIDASILVTNELNELYTNHWILNVVLREEKLFVESIGASKKDVEDELIQQAKLIAPATSTPAPEMQTTTN